MVSVSPVQIFNQTGITAYNRGSSRQLPEISVLNVEEALKNQDLKVVISNASTLAIKTDIDDDETYLRIGMDYKKLSIDKIRTAYQLCKKSEWQSVISYIFPVLRYHDNWMNTPDIIKTKKEKEQYDYMHGQYPVYKHMYQEDNVTGEGDGTFELRESAVEEQTKIAELCKENNCKMMLLEMPDTRWTQEKHDKVQQYADSIGATFVDFNVDNIIEKCGIDWHEDFYDGHHLNARGSVKANKYLCDVLVNDLGLKPSDVSLEVKEQFESDYEQYMKDLKTKKYKEKKK